MKLFLCIIFLLPLFFQAGCQKHTNPTEVENKDPIIVSDSWSLLPNSPGDMIWAMSVSNDGVLYAGIRGGLVRSSDNGLSWEQIYSSGTPNVIYISPYDNMIILSLPGTFRTTTIYSTNGGLTWEESIEQPSGSSIRYYLALPSGELLAGGFVHDESSGGIFISKDKGVTWKRVPDFVKEPSVLSFDLNSSNDIYALIAFPFTYDSTVIYCSIDQGQSWFEVSKPDTVDIYNMVINRNDAFIINTAEGIFISEDIKSGWNLISPSLHTGFITSLVLDSDDNLFATFHDEEDKMIKVLILSASTNIWYSIEGLNLPISEYDISTLIGKDRHIYLTTFSSGIYKTKKSIDSIISTN